jgi:hypothetical protein
MREVPDLYSMRGTVPDCMRGIRFVEEAPEFLYSMQGI